MTFESSKPTSSPSTPTFLGRVVSLLLIVTACRASMSGFVADASALESFGPQIANEKRQFNDVAIEGEGDAALDNALAALRASLGAGTEFRITDRNPGSVGRVYVVQTVNGKDVINARANMNVRSGKIVSAYDSFARNTNVEHKDAALSADEAGAKAVAHIKAKHDRTFVVDAEKPHAGSTVYLQLSDRSIREVYVVLVREGDVARYEAAVDAHSGDVLQLQNTVAS